MKENLGLPTFLLIGAAKSGTTTLFDSITQHPQVYRPFSKEPKFFNNDINFAKGIDWYVKTYFQKAYKFLVRGEATPHYLYWGEKSVSRICQTPGLENIKFIAIFRDPVKRAYSQYWMDVQREIEIFSFSEALERESERLSIHHKELETEGLLKYGYYRGGCYASLLQPYLNQFPRDRFHFILQDELRHDFTTTMQKLVQFLGIEPDFKFEPVFSNLAYEPRNNHLHHFLLFPSGWLYKIVRKILHLLPISHRYNIRRQIVQSNLRAVKYPNMDLEVEKNLRIRYYEEIHQLEEILGRDLNLWL